MPRGSRHGAAVVARRGSRGITYALKYVDAGGEQVWERLGRDTEGWTEPKARAELDARLVDVRREGKRKPSTVTVGAFCEEWLVTYPTAKRLKKSTADGYTTIVRQHLVPALGHLRVADLDVGQLERYVADRMSDGLGAGSVNRHLNVVSLIVKAARKRRLLRDNPVELVDRPQEPRRRWTILTPADVARVTVAFAEIAADADGEGGRRWVEQARAVFVVVYGTGLRRGEILGLRWKHVWLADPEGSVIRVEETYVRNRVDTPKSERSERTIAIGPIVAEALWARRAALVGHRPRVLPPGDGGTARPHALR